jgi:hypothetical protein
MKMVAVHRRRDAGHQRVRLAVETIARDPPLRRVREQHADIFRQTLRAIERHAQRIVVFAEIRILDEFAVIKRDDLSLNRLGIPKSGRG